MSSSKGSSKTLNTLGREDTTSTNTMQIAMQVLKERCGLLQKRITSLEDENNKLKLDHLNLSDMPNDEKDLMAKVIDLSNQKTHLTQYILMVSCENKKLWDFLSKNKHSLSGRGEAGASQMKTTGLLRSETFIQNSPSTKFLPKMVDSQYNDTSLEEISLKMISSFLQEKSDLVDQYDQMVELHAADDKIFNASSIGFNIADTEENDSLKEIKKQIDKLNELKKEMKQQQSDIQNILSTMETLRLGQTCKKCELGKRADHTPIKQNQVSKSETYVEAELLDSLTKWATPENSSSYQDNTCDQTSLSQTFSKKDENSNKATLENTPKGAASKNDSSGTIDKMCPMCGQYFFASVEFDAFTRHVESHFMHSEEDETDSIVDNFELVLNSIGNALN